MKNSIKLLKVPYVYSKTQISLVQSLKDKKCWFTYDQFLSLRDSFPEDFNFGLVLVNIYKIKALFIVFIRLYLLTKI